jgi:hypothetical protein
LDGLLDVMVVVIGYTLIRRSLSVRSDKRVPTHIVCAPSTGISLADLVQMMGRCMGNNRSVLEANGHDGVQVSEAGVLPTLFASLSWVAVQLLSD